MKSKLKTASFGFFALSLVALFAVTAILRLPGNIWKGGDDSSSMTVQQLTQKEVCFETPHVDGDLSNDEEFGAQKSPTKTDALAAVVGQTSHFDFTQMSNDKENGAEGERNIQSGEGTITTAFTPRVKPMILDVGFTNEIGETDGVAGAKFVQTPDGDLQGLAISQCVKPQTDFWFIGAGTTLKDVATLFLANPSPATSEVTVSVWGSSEKADLADDGTFKYVGDRTFGVPARTQSEVVLTAGVSGQDIIAVNVKAAYSPIAATILSRSLNGLTPFGIDYSNPLPAPSTSATIPGIKVSKDEKVSASLNLFSPEIAVTKDGQTDEEIHAHFTCVAPASVAPAETLKKDTSESAATELTEPTPEPNPEPSSSPSPTASPKASPSPSPSPSSSTKQTAAEKESADKKAKEDAEKEAAAKAGIAPECKSDPIDKLFTVSKSRVSSNQLDFLPDGIWVAELTSANSSKFIANSKVTAIVKDNGKADDNSDAKEFALISPVIETSNALIPISDREDAAIALTTDQTKAEVNYTVFDKVGKPVGSGVVTAEKDKPTLIQRSALSLPGLTGNFVRLTTGGCTEETAKEKNCETNKIFVNAVFLNPKTLSSLSPQIQELNNQTYTFSTKEIH